VENCIFCSILAGDLPSTKIYQDDICTGFMDIHPINPGHLLIVPNEHYIGLEDLPPETGQHIFAVGQKLARALQGSGLQCEGINLFLADGKAAMQEVFHFHLHVIPRFKDDGFGFQFSPRYAELPTKQELENNAFHIKRSLGELD
jgi:histidine triad (HIT) family protein